MWRRGGDGGHSEWVTGGVGSERGGPETVWECEMRAEQATGGRGGGGSETQRRERRGRLTRV